MLKADPMLKITQITDSMNSKSREEAISNHTLMAETSQDIRLARPVCPYPHFGGLFHSQSEIHM